MWVRPTKIDVFALCIALELLSMNSCLDLSLDRVALTLDAINVFAGPEKAFGELAEYLLNVTETIAQLFLAVFACIGSSDNSLLAGNPLFLITALLSRKLNRAHKRAVKVAYAAVKGRVVRWVASYTPAGLEAKFRVLGVSPGDAVMMHSSFSSFTGFQGSPKDVIDCLLNVLGPQGHLFMMSLPYTGSSHDYLLAGNPFDVGGVSRMGIIMRRARIRQGHHKQMALWSKNIE